MNAPTFIEEMLQQGSTAPPAFDPPEFGLALNQLREDLLTASWSAAHAAATRCIALAVGTLSSTYAGVPDQPPVTAFASRALLGVLLGAIARSGDAASHFHALRQALTEGEQPASEELLAQLDAIESGEQDPLDLYLGVEVDHSDLAVDLALAALVRGLLGSAHAAFNEAYDNEPIFPGADDELRESALKSIVEQFSEALNAEIERGYDLCREDAAASDFIQHALWFCQFAQRRLPRLARALAQGRHIYERRIEAGQGTAAERIGRVCVNGSLHLREATAATIAAQRLALSAIGVDRDEDVSAVRSHAKDLPFEKILPNGVNRPIHKLQDTADGTFVEIEGRVLSATASEDEEGRLIGRLDLEDPSSEATVSALGFFINPPNVGITEDAYVRLSGLFHPVAVLNSGEPAILIDRFAFTQIVSEQWRMAFLRLAFDWFPVYRNAHNLSWALGPHVIQQMPLDSTRAGAAELIFLRLGPAALQLEEVP